jgi:hypothetical protein
VMMGVPLIMAPGKTRFARKSVKLNQITGVSAGSFGMRPEVAWTLIM